MSALGFVCYATCWACKFDSHYDEPTAHTWMDADDAEAKDIPYDPAALTASHPCACRCSGGPGGCQPLGGAA